MSVFDSLFGSNATTSTQAQQFSGPAAAMVNDLFTRVSNYANQPYDALWNQPRDAGHVADQQTAFSQARNIAGTSNDIFNRLRTSVLDDQATRPTAAVRGLADRIAGFSSGDLGKTFDQANIAGYMNPYIDAVLNPAIGDIERRADQERNRLQGTAARTGSFGGSRNALAAAELERNTENEIGRLSANERARAFNEGASQFRQDQQNLPALAAAGMQGYKNLGDYQAQNYSNLATLNNANTGRLGSEVNSLLATGGLQQAFDQQVMDRMLSDRLDMRDWSGRGINAMMAALGLGGGVTGATTNTTTQGPQANRAGQLLGAATGILGSVGGLSGLSSMASGAWNGLSSLFGSSGGSSAGSGLFSGFSDGSSGLASIGDFGSW